MQLSNDTSKYSTSPPYLVKNERSLNAMFRHNGMTITLLTIGLMLRWDYVCIDVCILSRSSV